MRAVRVLIPSCLLAVTVASPAQAQYRVGAGIELGTTFASGLNTTLVSFSPVASLTLSTPLGLDLGLVIPVAVAHFSNVGTLAAIGNPELGVVVGLGPEQIRTELSAAVNFPLAQPMSESIHAGDFWRVTRGAAASARGFYDPQRWAEASTTLRGGVSVRITEGPVFGLVEAEVGTVVGEDPRLLGQGAAEAGLQLTEWMQLGVRLQFIGLTKQESMPRIICIARTVEECNLGSEPDPFEGQTLTFEAGNRALTEGTFIVSVIPGLRFLLPPAEISVGMSLNLTDSLALGAEDAGGPGFLVSAVFN